MIYRLGAQEAVLRRFREGNDSFRKRLLSPCTLVTLLLFVLRLVNRRHVMT